MLKRVFLFLLTNVLVIATISIITSVFGLNSYLTAYGINYEQLVFFCAIWGMGGAFISLLMSKFIAKMAMGVVIINPKTATQQEAFLIDIVYGLAKRAGITKMPEVGIYSSPEVNAFATGPSKNNSLVAVSSGLLSGMNRNEIEAVLGHEISHVANGDMVTMTLIQGVVNAFAMFLSRIVAYAISIAMSRGDEKEGEFSHMTFYALTFVFDIVFTLLGSILVAAFSRWREYRADNGGARLTGKDNMIAALRRLQGTADVEDSRAPSLAALKISQHSSWLALFSSHPPLAQRIARLQKNTQLK
ncbi:MAG: protease HtpX [Gammaproteobacteria bacterium]